MLDKMTKLQEQNRKVSARLHEMVLELAGLAQQVKNLAEQLTEE